eukprot:67447-Pyramimonas_sp.AAC.1
MMKRGSSRRENGPMAVHGRHADALGHDREQTSNRTPEEGSTAVSEADQPIQRSRASVGSTARPRMHASCTRSTSAPKRSDKTASGLQRSPRRNPRGNARS